MAQDTFNEIAKTSGTLSFFPTVGILFVRFIVSKLIILFSCPLFFLLKFIF